MRRNIALSLFMTLLLSIILTPLASEQAYAANNANLIINAIGIMDTDKGSNEVGAKTVTRARFAQMLINASSLKDSVSGESNISLFSDVKKSYWAAGYIQTAVAQGWMSGYLNGKFKPNQNITLQEAVYGVIKLLGYTNSDFTGNISSSIMKLYKTKDLNKNISKTKSQYLTVNDCYNLFYNTLKATTKTGSVYAVSLGYTVDSYGEIDYLSLVSTSMEGPIIADEDWKNELPFPTFQATFYKDGKECGISDISDYDVLYYSKNLKKVWVYDNKVTGSIETINPDYSDPQSVVVSGKTYTFADSNVALEFSSMGDFKEGEDVTLVLDKNDIVVDALSIDEYNTMITGVVLDTGTHVSEVNGQYESTNYVDIVDAAGNKYQQDYDKSSIYFYQGDLASISYKDGTATVSKTALSNTYTIDNKTFSSDGSKLGTISLASNVKILDLDGDQYISIYPERLAGMTLSISKVYYYEMNENGEISQLILCDVTQDMDKYGVITAVTAGISNKLSYNYMMGSVSGSFTTDNYANFSTDLGPKRFVYKDNAITAAYTLSGVTVTSIGSTTIQAGKVKYPLAKDCYVYILVGTKYFATTIDKISSLTKYNITAYYDNAVSAAGRIRVIVAKSE